MDAALQRAIHWLFGLSLIFLLYPSRASWSKTSMNWFDVLLAVLGACSCMYIVVFYQDLVLRAGMNSQTDFIVESYWYNTSV